MAKTGSLDSREGVVTEPNVIQKWLVSPVAHIATASYISAAMAGALGVMLLLHDQHVLNIVLLVGIAGASLLGHRRIR